MAIGTEVGLNDFTYRPLSSGQLRVNNHDVSVLSEVRRSGLPFLPGLQARKVIPDESRPESIG